MASRGLPGGLHPFIVGLIGCMLCGCTLSVPTKLQELMNVRDTEEQVARAVPDLTMHLHPDGLGWQVFVSQAVTRNVRTEADEYWQFRIYDLSGRSTPSRPENYDDICGPLLVLTPLFAPFDVESPPFWARWERSSSACAATPENTAVKFHDRWSVKTESRIDIEAVTEGHLALVWHALGGPDVVARIPLQENTQVTGTAVRLRWLAEMVRRSSRLSSIPQGGTVELRLLQQEQMILRKALPITAQDLEASLSDERIVSVPAERWPRDIVIRIAQDVQMPPGVDPALLIREAVVTLERLAVPVVLRGAEMDLWRADQVRFHQPLYRDLSSVDVAHVRGATVLLHLDVSEPFPQSRILNMQAVTIATGELLATLMIGGHQSQWPYVVNMGMRELNLLLQSVLDPVPVKPVGRHSGAHLGVRP